MTASNRLEDEPRRAAAARARLDAVVTSSSDAIFTKDLDETITSWNAGAAKIYGYSADEVVGRHADLLAPPELKNESRELVKRVCGGVTVYDFETTRVRKDGAVIDVSLTLCPVLDEERNVVEVSVISRDITERRRAERAQALLAAAVASSHDAIFTKGFDEIITSWNEGAAETFGYSAEEMIGQSTDTMMPPEAKQEPRQLTQRVRRGERIVDFESERVRKDGRRISLSLTLSPVCDSTGAVFAISVTARDMTARKRGEAALRHLNRELQAISECNQTLMRAGDEQKLLNDICRIVCEKAGYRMAWVGFAENDEAKTVRPVAWAGFEDGFLATAHICWADTEHGRGPSGTAIRTGEPCAIQDSATDPRAAPWREDAAERGYRSVIGLPLKGRDGKAFGTLTIYSDEVDSFLPSEMRLLGELAGDLAFGITTLRTREERDRVEAALLEERRLFIAGPNVAFKWKPVEGWPVEYVSPNVADQFGYDPEDLTSGKTAFASIIHPDDLDRVEREVTEHSEAGVPCFEQEYRLACGDGNYRWVHDFTVVGRDPDGAITRYQGYLADVTQRRQAEAQLRKETERGQVLLELHATASQLPDKELYEFALDQAVRLTESEIGFFHLVSDDQREVVFNTWNKAALRDCAAPNDTHRLLEQAGNWADCVREKRPIVYNDFPDSPNQKGFPEGHAPIRRFMSVPVYEDDDVRFVIGVANKPYDYLETDVVHVQLVANELNKIMGQRRAEELQREAARYARHLIEASIDPMVAIGQDGKITDVNLATERATGVPRAELIGTDFADYFTEPEKVKSGHRRVLETGSVRDVPLTLRDSLGGTVDVLYNASTYVNDAGEIQGVFATARDMTQLQKAQSETRSVLLQLVEAIALTVEKRDPYTAGHQKRVAQLATAIAERMGLDETTVEGVRVGATIHDIGKIYVPAEILSRPGQLSPPEWQIIQTHPSVGAEIVQGIHAPWPIAAMVLQHHERLDGSGYPHGLADDDIKLEARILAVADVVEAMASHRPYRPALGVERALQEVSGKRGTLFDERVVEACLALFDEGAFEFSS